MLPIFNYFLIVNIDNAQTVQDSLYITQLSVQKTHLSSL